MARRIVIRKSWQMLGFAQKQPFRDAGKQVFYRACGGQVKDDAIFVLSDLHRDLEIINNGNKDWVILYPELGNLSAGKRLQ